MCCRSAHCHHRTSSHPSWALPHSSCSSVRAGAEEGADHPADHPQAEVLRLQQTLAAREAQLEAKAGEQARLQDVVTQLMVRASQASM